MLAIASALFFFLAFSFAVGTISYMWSSYGHKARAALRLEHVPVRTIERERPIFVSSRHRIRIEGRPVAVLAKSRARVA